MKFVGIVFYLSVNYVYVYVVYCLRFWVYVKLENEIY